MVHWEFGFGIFCNKSVFLVQVNQVKKAAVDIVRGLTGSEDGLQSLSKYSKIALPSLARLLSENKVLILCKSMAFNCLMSWWCLTSFDCFFPKFCLSSVV